MRDFWKPMPVNGKLIRELLLLFLSAWLDVSDEFSERSEFIFLKKICHQRVVFAVYCHVLGVNVKLYVGLDGNKFMAEPDVVS